MNAFCCFHEGVEAVFFCSGCGNKLMCEDCYAKAHAKTTHNSLRVADVMESNSTKHIPFLEARLQALKDRLERTEKRTADLKELKEAVLARVHEFFEKALDDALSNRKKCLVYSLDSVKYDKNESGDISKRISLVESALSLGQGIAGSAGFLTEELANSYIAVEQMMDAKCAEPVLEAPEFTYQINFVEENINELYNAIGKVGAISVRKHLSKIPPMTPLTITQSSGMAVPSTTSTTTSSSSPRQQLPGNAVTISWTSPVEGFKFDYQVEYRVKGEQNFDMCWDSSDFLSCTLRGALRPGVTYVFRARCGYKALDEWSEWGALTTFCTASGSVQQQALPPSALDKSVSPEPRDSDDSVPLDSIIITAGKSLWNGVALSWKLDLCDKAACIHGITYQVERKRKSLFERKYHKVYEGEKTECICDDLEPETTYDVRVRCKCGDAWGKWSRTEVRTQAIPAVDCFRQELTSWHSVSVSWAPIPSYSGGTEGAAATTAIKYQVHKKLRSAAAYEQSPVYEGHEPHFEYNKLSHETAYQFRVRGGVGDTWGKWAEVVIRTPEVTSPDSIYAEANSWHEIAISWAPVPSYPGKPVTYQLVRKLQRSGNSSTRASLDGRPSGEFFGSYSRSRSLDIARRNSSSVAAQLTDTISPGQQQQQQYASPRMSYEWNEEDDSKPVYEGEDTTYTCGDFKPVETYDIQVRAGYEGTWSKWSKISITTPGLPQPTPLTATPKSWYEISLSWPEVSAPSDVTLSYQVDWKFGTEDDYDAGTLLYEGRRHAFTRSVFQPDTLYDFRYRVGLGKDKWSNWSESTRVRTPKIPQPEGVVAKEAEWNCAAFAWSPVQSQKGRNIKYRVRLHNNDSSDKQSADIVLTHSTEWNFGRLLPDTNYVFSVCAGCDKKWSEWSDPVVIRTLRAPAFAGSVWKECGAAVEAHKRYALQGGLATNIGGGWCTIVGNAPLVAGVVGTWTVRIGHTFFYGDGVYVGVAPIDIDQNAGQDNYRFCGWYYECYYSRLHSGPPHKVSGKEYGPRTKNGNYVRTGDTIDVLLDLAAVPTTLAFRVAGKDLGVAFEEIPLDRPLVPAAILGKENDSVKIENTTTK